MEFYLVHKSGSDSSCDNEENYITTDKEVVIRALKRGRKVFKIASGQEITKADVILS